MPELMRSTTVLQEMTLQSLLQPFAPARKRFTGWCSKPMYKGLLLGLVCFLLGQPALGWRLGAPLPEEAVLELDAPVRFGDILVAATPHLITLQDGRPAV